MLLHHLILRIWNFPLLQLREIKVVKSWLCTWPYACYHVHWRTCFPSRYGSSEMVPATRDHGAPCIYEQSRIRWLTLIGHWVHVSALCLTLAANSLAKVRREWGIARMQVVWCPGLGFSRSNMSRARPASAICRSISINIVSSTDVLVWIK